MLLHKVIVVIHVKRCRSASKAFSQIKVNIHLLVEQPEHLTDSGLIRVNLIRISN